MPKTGLKGKDVSSDHWSSGVKEDPNFTRFVIRILEGRSLLASDVETGKSDPVCFVWCGPKDSKLNDLEKVTDINAEENGVLMTDVCEKTCDPIWDPPRDLTFPIDVSDINLIENMKCSIYVRDEDLDENEVSSYDELGMVEFNFDDFIKEGKAMKNSIVKSAAWYKLKPTPGMKRVDGELKLSLSLIFAPNDLPAILDQLSPDKKKAATLSCSQLLQEKVKSKLLNQSTLEKSSTVGSIRPLSASGSRPTSATKRKPKNRPTTAPTLKASSIMSSSASVLEEQDEMQSVSNDFGSESQALREHDDLVSEPSYGNLIDSIQQNKFDERKLQPIIPEEPEEDIQEEDPNVLEYALPHGGDEGVYDEFGKKGIKAAKSAAKGAANLGKKAVSKSIKAISNSVSGPTSKKMDHSVASEMEKLGQNIGHLLNELPNLAKQLIPDKKQTERFFEDTKAKNVVNQKTIEHTAAIGAALGPISISEDHPSLTTSQKFPPQASKEPAALKNENISASGSRVSDPGGGSIKEESKIENEVEKPHEINEESNPLDPHLEVLPSEFDHPLPQGDQNLLAEAVKIGADTLVNTISNFDLSDPIQDVAKTVAGGVADLGKKTMSKSIKMMSGSASGPAVRNMKLSLLSGMEKVHDKAANMVGVDYERGKNRRSDSTADLFANGPVRGDQLFLGISFPFHLFFLISSLEGEENEASNDVRAVSSSSSQNHTQEIIKSAVQQLASSLSNLQIDDSFKEKTAMVLTGLYEISKKLMESPSSVPNTTNHESTNDMLTLQHENALQSMPGNTLIT